MAGFGDGCFQVLPVHTEAAVTAGMVTRWPRLLQCTGLFQVSTGTCLLPVTTAPV